MEIALIEHNNNGVETLRREFTRGHAVTLRPDQQPRLRGGEFIPFFGVPALTTTVLAELLQEQAPQVVFGVGIREGHSFRIHFHPLHYNQTQDTSALLKEMTSQLECIINTQIAQYRWADKRLNIRPAGIKKIIELSLKIARRSGLLHRGSLVKRILRSLQDKFLFYLERYCQDH